MAETIWGRIKHAWNVFKGSEDLEFAPVNGPVYYSRPDRPLLTRGNERTIITSIMNRIAMDVSNLTFKHVRVDEDGGYQETIDSKLNYCLTFEANIDQSSRAFMQDVVLSMFDEGTIAIVPIDTTINPRLSESYDVLTMRTGKIKEWSKDNVKVEVFNEARQIKQSIVVPKKSTAIIENPLYAVMNAPNSTLKRLTRKLAILDAIDEYSGSQKLDLIIQLPYTIKTQSRKDMAESRRSDIESQLASSKFGIAYIDGTEHVTQLNRPVENNLLKQIEYLTSMLYSQLGITTGVMDGSADGQQLTNYNNRIIGVISSTICEEMSRKFLSKTARTQLQRIMFFNDPFKLMPVNEIAQAADLFTRNEIMSSNEIRRKIGLSPSKDPKADQLVNANIAEKNGNGIENQAAAENDFINKIKNEAKKHKNI